MKKNKGNSGREGTCRCLYEKLSRRREINYINGLGILLHYVSFVLINNTMGL